MGYGVRGLEKSYVQLDTINSINKTIGLKLCDWIKITHLKALFSMGLRSSVWGEVADTISRSPRQLRDGRNLRGFMLLYGSIIQEWSAHKVMKLIIKTAIRLTANLIIWSAYRRLSIALDLKNLIWRKSERTLIDSAQRHPLGMAHQQEENGIENMPPKSPRRFLFQKTILASSVPQTLSQQDQRAHGTAPASAEKDIGENWQRVYNLTVDGRRFGQGQQGAEAWVTA